MTGQDLTPMTICLIASLVWAPLVYLAASALGRGRSLAAAELLWIVALGVAALPTIAAPALSAASLSLRPAPIVAIEANASAAAAPAARAAISSNARPAVPAVAAHLAGTGEAVSLPTLLSAAGLVYVYGLLLALAIYAFRAATFVREIARARPIDHPDLETELGRWARRLSVHANVPIVRSDAVATVCVAGFLQPKIVVPEAAGARFSFADLVMMGAHELAHIRRGDQALFFATAMARAFFWFNPFVKRIAARAELAAEESADALVLENGADRRRYAACFVEGLKFAADSRDHARLAAPSFTPFDRRGRRERLDAILSGKQRRAPTPANVTIALAAFAAAGAALAQAAFAVEPEPKFVARAAGEDVEFSARKGAPARATADGVVVAATDVYRGRPELGKVVAVKHDDGGLTRYARLESYSVEKGARVRRGDVLGAAGPATDLTIISARDAAVETATLPEPAQPSAPSSAPAAPEPAAPVAAPKPIAAPADPAKSAAARSADLDAALAGGEDDSNLRIFVKTDVRVKSEGGRFECGGDGAACGFSARKNARLVLKATGAESGDLAWSGCAASADGRSCVVDLKEAPVDVVVAEGRHRHALGGAGHEPSEFARSSLNAPEGGAYFFRSENGRTKWGVRAKDGTITWSEGLSDRDRKRFEAEMAKAREAFVEARARHARAADSPHFAFKDFDLSIDGAAIAKIRERAAADAQRLAERMKLSETELARIRREAWRAARDAGKAARDAGRDVEKMFDEDWFSGFESSWTCAESCDEDPDERARERAEQAAERAAERAEREAERIAREAEREAERLEREAEREAARIETESERAELEAELAERASALAEAERDLAEERAEIERLRSELEAARRRENSI